MRLYNLMLVVSTSVQTSFTLAVEFTSAIEVTNTSNERGPSSFDHSNDFIVDQGMKVHNHTDSEERMARRGAPLGRFLLQGVQKKILFTFYGGISEHKLTPASWRSVIVRDENILRRVRTPRKLNTNQDMYSLLDQVQHFIKAYRAKELLSKKVNLERLMADKQPEDLVEVLRHNKFFYFLDFERVGALQKLIEKLNEGLEKSLVLTSEEAKSPKLSLIDTLSTLFGQAKFASMLSAAKISPITGDDAKLLQNKLLISWQGSGKTVDEVWDILKSKTARLTAENLDTLVEFIALKFKNPAEARIELLSFLKKKLGEHKLVQAIVKEEKAEIQSAMSHLRDRYRNVNTALEETNHNELSTRLDTELFKKWKAEYTGPHELTKQLETELFQKWKGDKMNSNVLLEHIKTGLFHQWQTEEMSPNRLRQAPFQLPDNSRLERDYDAYLEENPLEESLMPLGT